MLTRLQVRTQIRNLIDDTDAKLWDDTQLDILIDGVFDWGWSLILESFPEKIHAVDNLTSLTSPGYFTATKAGDLTYRPHRIIQIIRSGFSYARVDPKRVIIEDSAVVVRDTLSRVWTQYGDQIHLFPYNTTDDVEVRYNYKPDAYSGLANDSTAVIWPEGHVDVVLYESAARALLRGNREDPGPLSQMADKALARMLADMGRPYSGPVMPGHGASDAPLNWGGE
jgi:hypothetical protein